MIRIITILFAMVHLFYLTIGTIGTFEFRLLHYVGATLIIYLLVLKELRSKTYKLLVWGVILLTLGSGLYLATEFESMLWRVSNPTTLDYVLAIITFVIVLDITRRTIGWALPLITLAFVLYALLGKYIPGQFGHAGFTLERIMVTNYVTMEGMFGTPLGIMARLIFVFILFGVALEISGAGNYFLNLAKSIAGHLAGGPAKMAVLGSGLFGSMSGSAVANTVATGSLTIPLMKRTGYQPHVAAAIEAAASTGGQMVPPIMGAAAFLISEYTGTPYIHLVVASILPMLIYYGGIYAFVHIEAKKQGIGGLPKEEVPPFWKTFKEGVYYFIPLIVIVTMFALKYSVALAASAGTGILFLIMLIKNRGNFNSILDALDEGTRSAVKVSAASICAGVVVGIVGLTGVGLKFSSLMLGLADGKLFLAILLVGLASFILGMGLPVVAAYIILIVVAGTGLEELGVPLLVAHLMVFWFSQLSNITPPVALAAFAGAGIAGADPMKSGVYACKIALGLPIIPILFAYRPLLVGIEGTTWLTALIHSIIVLLGIIAITGFFQNYLLRKCIAWERITVLLAGLGLLWPNFILNALGLLMLLIICFIQFKANKQFSGISEYSV